MSGDNNTCNGWAVELHITAVLFFLCLVTWIR